MLLPTLSVIVGLAVLVWSAERFVEGAAATARYLGMSTLLIGMVIIGFGTSAPEMVVSAFAASQGNPGLALGNAYGSNIANIALILGVTALLSPIAVHSGLLRKELPLLSAATLVAVVQLWDGELSRAEGWMLLILFVSLMGWSIIQGVRRRDDALGDEMAQTLDDEQSMSLGRALLWLLIGLVLLVLSSRLLVWGAVLIAQGLGVSDLFIGLTIVALGTSLPELASSLAAVRKGEHDLALGNVIGSNLFNTLAVVGIAASIHPFVIDPEVLTRDALVMSVLTLSLFVFGYGRGKAGRITRIAGLCLLGAFVAYTSWLLVTAMAA